jgi:hypothetical protein
MEVAGWQPLAETERLWSISEDRMMRLGRVEKIAKGEAFVERCLPAPISTRSIAGAASMGSRPKSASSRRRGKAALQFTRRLRKSENN